MERSGAFSGHKPRTFLCYLVCDVSRSMWDTNYASDSPSVGKGQRPPWDVINDWLPELANALDNNDEVRDIARLSVVAFSDSTKLVLPLTLLRDVKVIPTLPKGVETDYRDVFRFLNELVRSDTIRLEHHSAPYRPVIYFITDGDPQKDGRWQPSNVWLPERVRLGAPDFRLAPSVVALGLGTVNPETLKNVASTVPPGAACVGDPGQPIGELLTSMLEGVVQSITDSSETGELEFTTPPGWRRLL